jgi:lipopolysaccharide export system permease protein
MRLVYLYILRSLCLGFMAAAALLLPLFGFLDLISELDDIGRGSYGLGQAVLVTAMVLPRRAVELGPFIALLGGIVGLGQLSVSSELTAIRSAGVTVLRIGLVTLVAGIGLAVTLAATDQYVASPLQQDALQRRAQALSTPTDKVSGGVIWARDGQQLVRVGELRAGRMPLDVEIFRFSKDNYLQSYRHAAYATILADDVWQLHDVQIKEWSAAGQTNRQIGQQLWQPIIPRHRLGELTLPANSLSPQQLYRHLQFLHQIGQPAAVYAIALWQKLGLPFLTAAMILLTVPFTLRQSRHTALGLRLALGAVTGLVVYLANQIIEAVGMLFNLSPPLIGLFPPLAMLAVATALLLRINRKPG